MSGVAFGLVPFEGPLEDLVQRECLVDAAEKVDGIPAGRPPGAAISEFRRVDSRLLRSVRPDRPDRRPLRVIVDDKQQTAMNRRPVQVINPAVDSLKRDGALLLSKPVDEADLPGDEGRERDCRAIRRPARDHGTAAEPARAAARAWHDVQPRLLSAPGPEHQLGTVGRPAEPPCFRRAEDLDGVSSVNLLHHDLAVRRLGRDVRDPSAVRRQGRSWSPFR